MTTSTDIKIRTKSRFPAHGWLGMSLAILFWILNWTLPGTRTHWGFFPMWLGYFLAIDTIGDISIIKNNLNLIVG